MEGMSSIHGTIRRGGLKSMLEEHAVYGLDYLSERQAKAVWDLVREKGSDEDSFFPVEAGRVVLAVGPPGERHKRRLAFYLSRSAPNLSLSPYGRDRRVRARERSRTECPARPPERRKRRLSG